MKKYKKIEKSLKEPKKAKKAKKDKVIQKEEGSQEKKEENEVKKRGRPKKEIVEKKKEEVIVIRSVTFKHVGYCVECETVIGDIDCEGKHYRCKSCGSNDLISNLKKERKLEKRSKKEDWEWINSLSTSLKEY